MTSKKQEKEKGKKIDNASYEDIAENFDLSKDWDFDIESEEDKRRKKRNQKE